MTYKSYMNKSRKQVEKAGNLDGTENTASAKVEQRASDAGRYNYK